MVQRILRLISIRSVSPLICALFIVMASFQNSLAKGITGTILETMDAAGYTYLNLDTEEGKIWVAIPQTQVPQGEKVSVLEGMEMKDFHSNSLNRTFASIIFSPGMVDAGAKSLHGTSSKSSKPKPAGDDSFAAAVAAEGGSGAAATQVEPQQGSAGSMGAIAPFIETKVEKADGENSYTVAEIFEQAKELNGKKVRIRAQVVKFNANIMGKNWLHLQDGTGDPMQNSHDLVVTTTDELNSPKIIIVEGTVAVDKDFGAGYKYAVIVENSKIISQ